MNRNEIEFLQSARSLPSITITMPTYRVVPDNKQDSIRLKNLVNVTKERLLKDFSKREVEPLFERLDGLVASLDHEYNLDGLALFVNKDVARVVKLPFRLEESVVINDTFATRHLIYAMNRTVRYWVLALAEKPTRLFEATDDTLVEVTEGGFPMVPDEPSKTAMARLQGRSERVGEKYDGEEKFFHQVDDALGQFTKRVRRPLAVVGVERHLGSFRKVSKHADAIVAEIKGNHDMTSAHDLGKLVWPVVETALNERNILELSELEAAIKVHRYASTISEVWRYAHEGRGGALFVEEDYHEPARIDATGMHLTLSDSPELLDVLDDAVDDVIETVLKMNGRVVFVPNGSLNEHGRIALILRY